jgi:hypothetical protein
MFNMSLDETRLTRELLARRLRLAASPGRRRATRVPQVTDKLGP